MTKHFASEVETHPCKCLTLRLVNGHFVAQTSGELESVGTNTTGSDLNFETYAQYFDNSRSFRYNLDIKSRNASDYSFFFVNETTVEIDVTNKRLKLQS